MPELHSLTPILSVLQDRGLEGGAGDRRRMSGASGKVPAAIHVAPEAAAGGPLARLRDGDIIRLDARSGCLLALVPDLADRPVERPDLSANQYGVGRELFALFRRQAGASAAGASPLF
jgi:phosphogluconate dehydratase